MNTELKQQEALQNAANYSKVEGLFVAIWIDTDRRKKTPKFVLTHKGNSFSPVLDYDNMNHFLLGFIKAIELTKDKN